MKSVVKEIADRLGMKYVYFPSGQNWPGALLTRFEIVGSKNCPVVGGERPKDLFTRHWGMAEVRLSKRADPHRPFRPPAPRCRTGDPPTGNLGDAPVDEARSRSRKIHAPDR